MVRYFFLLIIFIGFFMTSIVKADVCNSDWWETATESSLRTLATDEGAFPEFCNVWEDTPLHFTVRTSQDAQAIATFIDITEADPLALNVYDETPFGFAQIRLSTARILAEYARQASSNAMRDVARTRTSGAIRHFENTIDSSSN